MTSDAAMNTPELLRALQRYVANIGITGSSLRNQGAPGVVAAARSFLADLDLTPLRATDPGGYTEWLDATTQQLLQRLPNDARNWGAARKATNIFTTQLFLNAVLAPAYGLSRLGDAMETPLDSMAAMKLQQIVGRRVLPRWPGVGRLTPEVSQRYQEAALGLARSKGMPRACVDIYLWRPLPE